jgi:hypothetical protein
MIPKMFHVKHFGPVPGENLTSRETTRSFDPVRSRDFLVQLESAEDARLNGPARRQTASEM